MSMPTPERAAQLHQIARQMSEVATQNKLTCQEVMTITISMFTTAARAAGLEIEALILILIKSWESKTSS